MGSIGQSAPAADASLPEATRPSRVREGSVDAFRWLCILAVLAQHSIYPERQSAETVGMLLTLKELASWCVCGFFLASGWLANPLEAGWSGLRSRSRRLLRPFLGVNLVLGAILVVFAMAGLPLPSGYEPLDPWFHLRQWGYLQGYGPQFYFLPLLLIVGSLVLAVARAAGRPMALVASFICLSAALFLGGVPAMAYGGDFVLLPFYAVSFATGLVLREDFRSRIAWTVVSCGLLLGAWTAYIGGGSAVFHCFLAAPLFSVVRVLVRGPWPSLTRWSSGALFLWHAPLVMTACSIVLARSGIVDVPGIVVTWVLTIVACQVLHLVLARSRWAPFLTL